MNVISSCANLIDTCVEFEGKFFYASFIYGDTDKPTRRIFWDHLLSLNATREAPWFITGDFNDLTCNAEKVGGPERPEASFTDLRTFLSEGDLYDLQHSGDCLSWRGKRGDYLVRCRLDRAVANGDWAELFPKARSQYLTYEGSDHKPVVSFFEPDKKKRRGLFRFDRRLKDNPEAKALIHKVWTEATNTTVNDRITAVRTALADWSRQQYQNSRILIDQKKLELERAQTNTANDTELILRVANELNAAYVAEEAYWRQRSRLLWLSLEKWRD